MTVFFYFFRKSAKGAVRERRVPFEKSLVPELVLDQIHEVGGAVPRSAFPVFDAALRYAEIFGKGFLRKSGLGAEFFYCHVSSLSACNTRQAAGYVAFDLPSFLYVGGFRRPVRWLIVASCSFCECD